MSVGQGVDGGEGGDSASFARRLADALARALVLTALVVAVSAAISFALGGRWLGVKYLLFVVGFLALGIGGVFSRPTPAWRDDPYIQRSGGSTPFQSLVDRLLGGFGLPADERFPTGIRVLLAGLLMLGISFVMETVFGVVIGV
jgi:hypothetical protein